MVLNLEAMIFVGTFTERQVAAKEHRRAAEKIRKDNPDHKYMKTRIAGNRLKVWLATFSEYADGDNQEK